MSKHIAGPNPCQCGNARPTVRNVVRGHKIDCHFCGRSGGTAASIVKAIADWNRQTAAPDLLEALRKAAQDLRGVAIKNEESGPDSFQWINDWIHEKANEVDAAIAKAETTA